MKAPFPGARPEYSCADRAVTIPNSQRFPQPLVVAHRGASADHPENTLAAFEAAARAGADLVELDVRLTADGVPVVLHDPDLARTTDAAGPVAELTLAEVKRADASGGRGPRQEVPTLAEVLGLLAGTPTGVDVEVKGLPAGPGAGPGGEEALEASLRVLDEAGFAGPAIISSFDPATLARSRALAPHIPTGLLTAPGFDPEDALRLAREAGHAWLLPHISVVLEGGAALVGEAHAAGLALGTWTVDDEATLGRLFALGVDAVATNRPALAVAVRARSARP